MWTVPQTLSSRTPSNALSLRKRCIHFHVGAKGENAPAEASGTLYIAKHLAMSLYIALGEFWIIQNAILLYGFPVQISNFDIARCSIDKRNSYAKTLRTVLQDDTTEFDCLPFGMTSVPSIQNAAGYELSREIRPLGLRFWMLLYRFWISWLFMCVSHCTPRASRSICKLVNRTETFFALASRACCSSKGAQNASPEPKCARAAAQSARNAFSAQSEQTLNTLVLEFFLRSLFWEADLLSRCAPDLLRSVRNALWNTADGSLCSVPAKSPTLESSCNTFLCSTEVSDTRITWSWVFVLALVVLIASFDKELVQS